jgi:hypothetical protein
MWHDIYTKFHGDRFRNSIDMVITATVSNIPVLVLLMAGIYEANLRWHDVHTSFVKDR